MCVSVKLMFVAPLAQVIGHASVRYFHYKFI